MHQHNKSSKLHHELLLLKVVKSLKENSVREEVKLKEKVVEIEQLKELTAKMDIELNGLKKLNAKIGAELSEVKHDVKDLKTQLENNLKTNAEALTAYFKQFNEKQTKPNKKVDQLAKDVDNLHEFAENVGDLHCILGNELEEKRTINNIGALFKDEYDKDIAVKRWNKMITEVNQKKYQNKCQHLLRDSINKYKNVIFCSSYEQRLFKFVGSIPYGTFKGYFVRIHCYSFTKSICVSWGNSFSVLKRKFDEHDSYPKVQNSHNVCCFYDNSNCLQIILAIQRKYDIHLLHKSNESEKLKLSNETEIKWDDISKYLINPDSIVLWVKEV